MWSLPPIERSAEGESQYDPAFVGPICARVARGESLRSICRDPAMPSVQTLSVWRRREPELEQALDVARRTARVEAEAWRQALRAQARNDVLRRREGLYRNRGRTSGYGALRAEVICLRTIAGMSLEAICHHPAMPSVATVHNWLRRYPEFKERYNWARRFRLYLLGDRMIELADNATLETLPLVKLKIEVLKAEARRMGDPARFAAAPKRPVINVTTVRWEDIKHERDW